MNRNYERCKASQQEKLCHFHFNTKCKQKNMHVNLIRKMKMLVCCCYDRGETGTETTYRDVRRTRRLTVTIEIPFSNSSSSSGSSHHWDGWLTLCSFFFIANFPRIFACVHYAWLSHTNIWHPHLDKWYRQRDSKISEQKREKNIDNDRCTSDDGERYTYVMNKFIVFPTAKKKRHRESFYFSLKLNT